MECNGNLLYCLIWNLNTDIIDANGWHKYTYTYSIDEKA